MMDNNDNEKNTTIEDGEAPAVSRSDDDDEGVHVEDHEPKEETGAAAAGDAKPAAHATGDDQSEDLDDILANMDLDKDFTASFSDQLDLDTAAAAESELKTAETEDSTVNNNTEVVLDAHGGTSIHVTEHSSNHPSEQKDGPDSELLWTQRLQREELFSSRYRPSAAEERELQDLELAIGITQPRKPRLFSFGRSNSKNKVSEAQKQSWQEIARPEQQQPSVLLKRGSCWFQPDTSTTTEQSECEVIFLTRGMAIALQNNSTDDNPSLQFHSALSWNEVEFVQPTQRGFLVTTTRTNIDNDDEENTQQKLQQQLTFACANLEQRQAWMDAFHTVLVHYHTHSSSSDKKSANANSFILGWQYQHVYRPGFTLAVTNCVTPEMEALDRQYASSQCLNEVDDYHGYAPLHYAVRCHHVPAMASLLQHTDAIDVDVEDADGHTPLYLAVRDELPAPTLQLLRDHGARPVEPADVSQRGELFGRVAATEQIREERHQQQEQERQAKAAQADMARNMKLLQRRGEQIDELGDKATDLNRGAADFASMAKQLKEQTKKKSKWFPL